MTKAEDEIVEVHSMTAQQIKEYDDVLRGAAMKLVEVTAQAPGFCASRLVCRHRIYTEEPIEPVFFCGECYDLMAEDFWRRVARGDLRILPDA